ncbi:MAG: hypothetical protein OCD01_17510 [Fibrobacterales bacterium]
MNITSLFLCLSFVVIINCNLAQTDNAVHTQSEVGSSGASSESPLRLKGDETISSSSSNLISFDVPDNSSFESSSEIEDDLVDTSSDDVSDGIVNEYCLEKSTIGRDAIGVGDCSEEVGAFFNGNDCEAIRGCRCEGEDCEELFNDVDHCYFLMDSYKCVDLFDDPYCWGYGEKYMLEDTIPTMPYDSKCRSKRLVCGDEGVFFKVDPLPCVSCIASDGYEVFEEETYFDGCETYKCTLEGELELIENQNITCGIDRVTYPDACSNSGLIFHEGDCSLSENFEQLSKIIMDQGRSSNPAYKVAAPIMLKQTVSIQQPFEHHHYQLIVIFDHKKQTVTIKKEDDVDSDIGNSGVVVIFTESFGSSVYNEFKQAYNSGDIYYENSECNQLNTCSNRYSVEFIYNSEEEEFSVLADIPGEKDARLIKKEFLDLMQEYIDKSE